ncbi:MAG: hypothetical protein CM15mV42_0480 [uncultured marine virus]|nr:MAG: hypothetical protein CM15mV42_0480 [uncultured marine virus]
MAKSPFLDLIEVDKVEASCAGIASGCTIKEPNKNFQHLWKVIGDR